MNRLFQPPQDQNTSKRLCSVESVSRHRQKWEQAIRETAARKLWEKESEISIWAVDTHCELHPEINSPKGSLRRKKGYEDGRHLVRAIGNCVRSNDLSPLSQEILSWFAIGDPAMRVTAQDVEFFVTFVHQGCRRSLGSKDLYMTDELMESAKALCRQAGSCWDLRTHATAIAETAYSLLLQQAPSLNHVSQSWVQPGQVHDDEKFLLALSDILNRHAYDALQHVTRWLLENQLLHVDYPLEYWNARLTCLQQAISKHAGFSATRRTECLFEALRRNSERFWVAGTIFRVASLVAHQTARNLAEAHQVSDGTSPTQRVATLQQMAENLLKELASLHAANHLNAEDTTLACHWVEKFSLQLPWTAKQQQLDFLDCLFEQIRRHADEPGLDLFFQESEYLKQIIERIHQLEPWKSFPEQVPALVKNEVAPDVTDAAFKPLAHLPGALLASALEIATLYNPEQAQAEYGRWLVDLILPRFDAAGTQVNAACTTLENWLREKQDTALQETLQPFLDLTRQAIGNWSTREKILAQAEKAMPEAIRACYEIIPQHPARRNGEKVNGHRDGMFLIEEIIRVSCMGKLGLKRLLNWYRDEIAFNANMPAMGLQAYLDYLKQSMKEFPTVAKYLKAVSEATPGYTASLKLYQLAVRTSEPLAHAVLQQLPEIEKYLGKGDRTVLQHSIHTLLRSASRMLARQAETGDRLQNVAVQLKPHSVFAQSPQGTRLVHYVMNKVLPEMDDHERQKVETTFAAITTLFAGK